MFSGYFLSLAHNWSRSSFERKWFRFLLSVLHCLCVQSDLNFLCDWFHLLTTAGFPAKWKYVVSFLSILDFWMWMKSMLRMLPFRWGNVTGGSEMELGLTCGIMRIWHSLYEFRDYMNLCIALRGWEFGLYSSICRWLPGSIFSFLLTEFDCKTRFLSMFNVKFGCRLDFKSFCFPCHQSLSLGSPFCFFSTFSFNHILTGEVLIHYENFIFCLDAVDWLTNHAGKFQDAVLVSSTCVCFVHSY